MTTRDEAVKSISKLIGSTIEKHGIMAGVDAIDHALNTHFSAPSTIGAKEKRERKKEDSSSVSSHYARVIAQLSDYFNDFTNGDAMKKLAPYRTIHASALPWYPPIYYRFSVLFELLGDTPGAEFNRIRSLLEKARRLVDVSTTRDIINELYRINNALIKVLWVGSSKSSYIYNAYRRYFDSVARQKSLMEDLEREPMSECLYQIEGFLVTMFLDMRQLFDWLVSRVNEIFYLKEDGQPGVAAPRSYYGAPTHSYSTGKPIDFELELPLEDQGYTGFIWDFYNIRLK
jgi:hypothetical protein